MVLGSADGGPPRRRYRGAGLGGANLLPRYPPHRSVERAEAHLRQHPELHGGVLRPVEAMDAAEQLFGDLLALCCR